MINSKKIKWDSSRKPKSSDWEVDRWPDPDFWPKPKDPTDGGWFPYKVKK